MRWSFTDNSFYYFLYTGVVQTIVLLSDGQVFFPPNAQLQIEHFEEKPKLSVLRMEQLTFPMAREVCDLLSTFELILKTIPAVPNLQVLRTLDKPQAASSNNPDSQYPPDVKAGMGDELCQVCGDKVSEHHSGPVVCEDCKVFFRRWVKHRTRYFSARGPQSQRKGCPARRFEKCLAVGMKLELVEDASPTLRPLKHYSRHMPYQQYAAKNASQHRHTRRKQEYGEDELIQDFQQNVTVREDRSDEMQMELPIHRLKIE